MHLASFACRTCPTGRRVADFRSSRRETRLRLSRRLLIIWLLQQAPIGSVKGCPDQRFPRRFASFSPTLPPRRPARSIWRHVVGQMGSFALDAGTKDPTKAPAMRVGGEQAGLRGSRQLKERRAALVLVAVEK